MRRFTLLFFLSISMYFLHTFYAHDTHHSYMHVITCLQSEHSLLHKLGDILSIDFGANHLEACKQVDIDFHIADALTFVVLSSEVEKPKPVTVQFFGLSFFDYVVYPEHAYYDYTNIFRGPPMQS